MSDFEARIRTANVRTYAPLPGETAVYIGRGRAPTGMEHGSFGNPFRVGPDYAQGEAAAAFLPYLRAEYRQQGDLYRRVNALAARLLNGEHLALVCWCDPEPCHAAHVMAAVLSVAKRQAAPSRIVLPVTGAHT